jgi:hypothetical protein
MRDHILYNAGAIIPRRDRVDSTWIQDVLNGTGKVKDAVGPFPKTIYWPTGTVLSFTDGGGNDTIRVIAVAGGVTEDRYNNLTIEVDFTNDGSWDESHTITKTIVLDENSADPDTTVLTCGNWTNGTPSSASAYRIHNSYSDATRATLPYPVYNAGSAPLDTDGDYLPDWIETIIGSDPTSSTPPNDAMGNIDGDGYKNVEEWSHYFYSWQPPKLIKR